VKTVYEFEDSYTALARDYHRPPTIYARSSKFFAIRGIERGVVVHAASPSSRRAFRCGASFPAT